VTNQFLAASEIAGIFVCGLGCVLIVMLARSARQRMEESRKQTALLIEYRRSPERVREFLERG